MLTSTIVNTPITRCFSFLIRGLGDKDVFVSNLYLEKINLKKLSTYPRIGFEINDDNDRVVTSNATPL